jgi:hypothetical protein
MEHTHFSFARGGGILMQETIAFDDLRGTRIATKIGTSTPHLWQSLVCDLDEGCVKLDSAEVERNSVLCQSRFLATGQPRDKPGVEGIQFGRRGSKLVVCESKPLCANHLPPASPKTLNSKP